jgi:putative hydrolase of the HAD superfamily
VNIQALLFDYGGVLAEEGFREGLFSIARQQGLEPDAFYQAAQEGVYDSGFVSGKGTEADFWRYMRERFPYRVTTHRFPLTSSSVSYCARI